MQPPHMTMELTPMKRLPNGLIDWRRTRELTGYPGSEDLARDSRDGFFVKPVPPPDDGDKHFHRLYRLSEVERWVKTYGRWDRALRSRHSAKIHSSVRLMNIKEFAAAAEIKEHTLRRMAKGSGRPPFPKPISKPLPGRPSLWREADVKAWISRRAG